jgi:hypothetical protein
MQSRCCPPVVSTRHSCLSLHTKRLWSTTNHNTCTPSRINMHLRQVSQHRPVLCASCAQAPAAQTPATVHIISSVRYTAATRVQARQGLAPTACKQITHASSVLLMKTNLSTVAAHCHCFPCPGQRTQTQLAGASIAVSGTIMNHPTQPPTTYKAQACTDQASQWHI